MTNEKKFAKTSLALFLLAAITIAAVASAYLAPRAYAQLPNVGDYIVTDLGSLPNTPPMLWWVPQPAGPPAFLWPDGPFVSPTGVAIDAAGNYIVADPGPPPMLWMKPPAGGVPPIAIPAGGLVSPTGVAIDAAGNYIVADPGPPGMLWLVPMGGGAAVPLLPVGPLVSPTGVAIDAAGNYIVADPGPPPALWLVPMGGGGAVPLVPPGGPFVSPTGVAIDAAGNYIVADQAGVLWWVPMGGGAPVIIWAGNPFGIPSDVAIDAAGNYIVADQIGALWLVPAPGGVAPGPIWLGAPFAKPRGVAIVLQPPAPRLAQLSGFTSLPTGNMTMVVGDISVNPHGTKPPGVNFQIGRDSTPLGFVSGMLVNPQPSIFDTNSTWINSTSGRPFSSIPPDLIFSIGGPGINSVSHYYETTTNMTDKAPITFSMNATHYIWTDRNGNQVLAVLRSSCSVPPGTNDVFVIQILRDADGRLVTVMYGTHYTGTWAAAWWFKFVVYPSISSYQNRYYIVQWTDAAAGTGSNYTPDLGDTYTILAQG